MLKAIKYFKHYNSAFEYVYMATLSKKKVKKQCSADGRRFDFCIPSCNNFFIHEYDIKKCFRWCRRREH